MSEVKTGMASTTTLPSSLLDKVRNGNGNGNGANKPTVAATKESTKHYYFRSEKSFLRFFVYWNISTKVAVAFENHFFKTPDTKLADAVRKQAAHFGIKEVTGDEYVKAFTLPNVENSIDEGKE